MNLIRSEKYNKLSAEDKTWYANAYKIWSAAKRKVEEFETDAKVMRYLEYGISMDEPLRGNESMPAEYEASKNYLKRAEKKLNEELEAMGC